MNYSKIQKDDGAALLWVIVIMLVFTILSAALISISLAETNHAVRQERSTQAHYVARAGIEAVTAAILVDQSTANITTLINTPSITGDIDGNEFLVRVEDVNGNQRELKIVSTGEVNGITETISLTVGKGKSAFPHALFGDEYLYLGPAETKVYGGNVSTNIVSEEGHNPGTITFVPTHHEILYNANYIFPEIKTELFTEEIEPIESAITISIDEYTEENVVFIKTPFIKQSGQNIVFEGPGEIHLLVEDSFKLNSGITADANTEVYIYYTGESEMEIGGNADIDMVGFIYAPNARVRLNGGGNGNIYVSGSITAKELHFNGGKVTITYIGDSSTEAFETQYQPLFWSEGN
ncbi:MAG: hypothetical protein NUK65_02845 [Firmicutes bacterium]|nr:hypothetical protein [Bacillota bacterium]